MKESFEAHEKEIACLQELRLELEQDIQDKTAALDIDQECLAVNYGPVSGMFGAKLILCPVIFPLHPPKKSATTRSKSGCLILLPCSVTHGMASGSCLTVPVHVLVLFSTVFVLIHTNVSLAKFKDDGKSIASPRGMASTTSLATSGGVFVPTSPSTAGARAPASPRARTSAALRPSPSHGRREALLRPAQWTTGTNEMCESCERHVATARRLRDKTRQLIAQGSALEESRHEDVLRAFQVKSRGWDS